MTEINKRRHPRCSKDTSISFATFNKKKQYQALTRNYCRTGMYFEAEKRLQPGLIIQIRPVDCTAEHQAGKVAPYYCTKVLPGEPSCLELKTLVLAQVRRCTIISDVRPYRYGIGVEYVSPAV